MDTHINPQMLSPEALHEAHLEMAKNYLESKWDGYYYELDTITEESDSDDVENYEDEGNWLESLQIDDSYPDRYSQGGYHYVKLSSEQRSQIQKRIDESGEKLLYKVLADEPELKKLILLEYEFGEDDYFDQYYGFASRIGDTPHQTCEITVCTIDPDGKTQVFPFNILLAKEEYLKLLVIFMDHRDVTFNDLYEYDLELFKKISKELTTEAKKHSEKNNKQSYTLVFDEIEEDVHALLGEDESDVWYEDEEAYTDKRIHLEVHFSEKKMSVVQLLYDIDGLKDYSLYNVNAKRVLEVLNVNTYHDALISLKDRFYIPHVVTLSPFYKIKEFLDHEKIGYEYSEERMGLEE